MSGSTDGARIAGKVRSHWILLLAGFVVHAVATFYWLREGGFFDRPPIQDAAWTRLEAKAILDRGAPEGIVGLAVAAYRFENYHPPLFPLVIALIAHFSESELEGVALWIPTLLFGFLLLSVSGLLIGHVLHPAHRWFASMLLLCAPGFIVYLRLGFSQMPMIALALLSAYFLLSSNWLERLSRVALAGVFAALAVFTKNLALIEVGGFSAAYLVLTVARRQMPIGRVLGRVVVFLFPIVLLNAAWYVSNYDMIVSYTRKITGPAGQVVWSQAIPLSSVRRWIALPWYFCRFCLGVPVAIAAAILVVAAIARWLRARLPPRFATLWQDGRGLSCLVVGAFVSYVVMSFGQVHPDAYFIIQWIPVYVLLLAPLGYLLQPRVALLLRTLVVVTAAAMAVLAYVPFQKGDPLLEIGGWPIVDHFDSRKLAAAAREAGGRPRPDVERWPVGGLVDAAARWAGRPRAMIGLLSQNDTPSPYLLETNIVYESWRQGLEVDLTELTLSGRSVKEAAGMIASCDVLCVDSKMGTAQDIAGVLRAEGVRLEHLEDFPVTDRWKYFLFGIRRD